MLPTDADQVVVQGFLLDERTGRGDVTATITSKPVPLTGQDAVRPLLLDPVAHTHIRTATRTTVPDEPDGYWAVLAVSNTDPDLTAYGGREVTLPGHPVRTIEVRHDADYVTVTPQMAAQINRGLTYPLVVENQQVRAIWFHQAATYSPPPAGPSYFTAEQVVDVVEAGIDAHDTDTLAHPDIRALIEQGGVGGSGAARLTTSRTAATILSGHRVVTPTSTGSVRYADAASLGDVDAPLWVTTGAAASGTPVQVVLAGEVVESSWSWTRGPVYLAADGVLTQTVPARPTAAFLARVGVATSPTALHVDRQPSVVLA